MLYWLSVQRHRYVKAAAKIGYSRPTDKLSVLWLREYHLITLVGRSALLRPSKLLSFVVLHCRPLTVGELFEQGTWPFFVGHAGAIYSDYVNSTKNEIIVSGPSYFTNNRAIRHGGKGKSSALGICGPWGVARLYNLAITNFVIVRHTYLKPISSRDVVQCGTNSVSSFHMFNTVYFSTVMLQHWLYFVLGALPAGAIYISDTEYCRERSNTNLTFLNVTYFDSNSAGFDGGKNMSVPQKEISRVDV